MKSFSIDLNNGVATNKRKTIIGTNANPIHWRLYVGPMGDELNACGHLME